MENLTTIKPGIPTTRLTAALIRSALVAGLGGLLFGFDTAVISGTTDWLKSEFVTRAAEQMQTWVPFLKSVSLPAATNFVLGLTVASALIGTILGSISVGKPADTYGRRGVLFALALLFFLSSLGCALALNWSMFLLFRFLGGIGVGGASVLSPLYIAEISPARYRGRLVAVAQFNIVAGILLAYGSNYLIGSLHLGAAECRWMFGVMALPSLAFFFLLFFTPQSPRWLMAKQRESEARAVLEMCGTDPSALDAEVNEIKASLDLQHHTLEEPFYCRKYLKPILLAVAIAAFNQLSGINALIYYTKHIFEMAGYGSTDALRQSVIIGFTNLVFTMAAMSVIDHFGRRKLMLVGSIGYILSLAAAAFAFHKIQSADAALQAGALVEAARNAIVSTYGRMLLISLVVFIASHAFGQGAVIWVFIGEVFPNRVRARGQALGSFTHWVMAAAISWTFPMIAAASGWMTFAFYAFCMVGQLLWVLTVMPETKGITLERIQQQLGID